MRYYSLKMFKNRKKGDFRILQEDAILLTNAHRRNFNTLNPLKSNKLKKFKHLIKPLFRGGGMQPDLGKSMNFNTSDVEFVY